MKNYIKYGSGEMLNYKLNAHGGHPSTLVAPQKYNKLQTVTTSLSLSAGEEWGEGTVPSFIVPVLCISYTYHKEFSRA
jgi:hypothetical protein